MERGRKHSPNMVLLAFICCVLVYGAGSARFLWIGGSRVSHLPLRTALVALADAIASLVEPSGIDRFIPDLRSRFLSLTGLSSHQAWDIRYYNVRQAVEPAIPPPEPSPIAVDNQEQLPLSVSLDTGTAVSPYTGAGQGLRIFSAEKPLRVFAFGDSQTHSLGNGLARLVGRDGPVSVDVLAVHSTGFIRGDYYNWVAKLADTFSTERYDAAVVMLGMNDYQNFYNAAGRALRKETADWETEYHARCRRIIDLLLMHVERVYWIGMPVVQNPVYNRSLEYIDTVQSRLASEYSPETLVRVSLRDQFPGPGRPFTDTVLLPDGSTLRVMTQDGTHFTVEGGQLAMQGLFERLRTDFLFAQLPQPVLP